MYSIGQTPTSIGHTSLVDAHVAFCVDSPSWQLATPFGVRYNELHVSMSYPTPPICHKCLYPKSFLPHCVPAWYRTELRGSFFLGYSGMPLDVKNTEIFTLGKPLLVLWAYTLEILWICTCTIALGMLRFVTARNHSIFMTKGHGGKTHETWEPVWGRKIVTWHSTQLNPVATCPASQPASLPSSPLARCSPRSCCPCQCQPPGGLG